MAHRLEAAAREAITWCRRSLRANYEAMAHGVLARALVRRDGMAARAAVNAALDSAAALIEHTGACSLAPALLEWRAEFAASVGDTSACENLLDEAVQGYAEIGAPKHVERLVAWREMHEK